MTFILKDTGEQVAPVDVHGAVVPSWGTEGWDLGHWPLIMFYLGTGKDQEGRTVHGYAVNVEGDLAAYWFRSEGARDLAVSKEAWWYWCMGQASGPAWLLGRDPDGFELVPSLCEPYRFELSTEGKKQ